MGGMHFFKYAKLALRNLTLVNEIPDTVTIICHYRRKGNCTSSEGTFSHYNKIFNKSMLSNPGRVLIWRT
jgi:hypothetical protein